MRAEHKERVLTLVRERICERLIGGAEVGCEATNRRVEGVLGDTIFHELARLEKERDSRRKRVELARMMSARRQLFELEDWGRRKLLADFVETFAGEVMGNWNPTVYGFATRLLPSSLSALLNATSPGKLVKSYGQLPNIDDRIILDGHVDAVRALEKRGTLIFAPTHSSNLDSIVIGYSLFAHGLPPVSYGAGINLFTNPMLSFFMHNLGAYKVDRKKNSRLYKDVLKEYATVSMELGYPNLFFPGGTRSRSGEVESRLKLGLLGCGLSSFVNNLKAGEERPRVFVIPVNLSYELVLEAENLIEDQLKADGQARAIITDDEFSRPKRVYDFIRSIFDLDARIYMTLGEPLDPFGHRVTEDGCSRDRRGREIDIDRYVLDRAGRPSADPQRDAQYTRELGEELTAQYLKHNTLMSTHLMAFVVFELARRRRPGLDLYRFLRESRLCEEGFAATEVEVALGAAHRRLGELEQQGALRLDARIRGLSPGELLLEGLRGLGIYHSRPVVERRGDRVFVVDSKLLLFYRNRLVRYGLEESIP